MKRLPMLLIPCIAISATAATFNAQGKIINSKDAKNPGIVKFEKDKIATTKNNLNKPTALAKDYAPHHVEKTWGEYHPNNNSNQRYKLNNTWRTTEKYFELIDKHEKADIPRNYHKSNYNSEQSKYYSYSLIPYPNKTGNNCESITSNYFFYSVPEPEFSSYSGKNDILRNFSHGANNEINNNRCTNNPSDKYYRTCGQDINIYNIVGDDKIQLPYNTVDYNCADSRTQNYKEGIKHNFANQIIKVVSNNVNNNNSYKDRNGFYFAQHPYDPYGNNLFIGNVIATSLKNQSAYNQEAAALDDYIYYNRVIEFVPYTENGQKTGAGVSLNAISVAGISADDFVRGVNQYGHLTLNQNDPKYPRFVANLLSSEYRKPEIYTISNVMFNSNRIIKHDGNQADLLAIRDSWGASSIAAAMTANLMSKHPFYKWHPEVVKALWLTAYSDSDRQDIYQNNDTQVKQSEKFAKFDDLLFNNESRYWYGNNGDFFENETLTFTESVEPGQKYATAIAWLVRGDYAIESENLSSNYQLNIYNAATGSILASSLKLTSTKRMATYRKLDFTVPAGVNQVRIEITRTRNTGDRIILGYNMHKLAHITY